MAYKVSPSRTCTDIPHALRPHCTEETQGPKAYLEHDFARLQVAGSGIRKSRYAKQGDREGSDTNAAEVTHDYLHPHHPEWFWLQGACARYPQMCRQGLAKKPGEVLLKHIHILPAIVNHTAQLDQLAASETTPPRARQSVVPALYAQLLLLLFGEVELGLQHLRPLVAANKLALDAIVGYLGTLGLGGHN
eukprot:scaffold179_cov368-Prasinococcus_capsulatus_cf.AAC.3